MTTLSRAELIRLVEKLLSNKGTEAQERRWIAILEQNVPHPAITDVIYWSEEDLSAEEIVDRALSYKPISMGPSSLEKHRDDKE